MPRALLPGRWNSHSRAIPDPQRCEMDSDVAPDFYRVIATPLPSPEDRIFLARVRRWAVARALGAAALLATLLALFGAQCFKS